MMSQRTASSTSTSRDGLRTDGLRGAATNQRDRHPDGTWGRRTSRAAVGLEGWVGIALAGVVVGISASWWLARLLADCSSGYPLAIHWFSSQGRSCSRLSRWWMRGFRRAARRGWIHPVCCERNEARLRRRSTEGWRRERDSNPRYPSGYSGFQDHRHRPLGHPSASNIRPEFACLTRIEADSLRQCNRKCNDRDSARRAMYNFTAGFATPGWRASPPIRSSTSYAVIRSSRRRRPRAASGTLAVQRIYRECAAFAEGRRTLRLLCAFLQPSPFPPVSSFQLRAVTTTVAQRTRPL